jgi:hypothetical protein
MTDHARQRAAERFGLRLTDADIATIRADIAAGRAANPKETDPWPRP